MFIVHNHGVIEGYTDTMEDAQVIQGEGVILDIDPDNIPHSEYFADQFTKYRVFKDRVTLDANDKELEAMRVFYEAEVIDQDAYMNDDLNTQYITPTITSGGITVELTEKTLAFLHLQVDAAILKDTDVQFFSEGKLVTEKVEVVEKLLEELTISLADLAIQTEMEKIERQA